MDTWHVIDRAGRQHGPLSHYDVAKMVQSGIASGAFGAESEIWHQSFGATWKTIATSEFSHLLAAPPPARQEPRLQPPAQPRPHPGHPQPYQQAQQHPHGGQAQDHHGWNQGGFAVNAPFFPEKSIVVIVYVLYLLGIISFFLTPLIGLIIAYVQRGSSTPTGRSHFTFQIHTFWLSVLYAVLFYVAATIFLALFAGIGFLSPVAGWSGFGLWLVSFAVIAIGQFVWQLVRVIKGLMYANGSRPIANPTSWWLG
jgi:uncharacterized membrane protein